MPLNNLNPVVEKKLAQGRAFRFMEMRAINDDEYIVEGYATTFDDPYVLFSWDGYTVREVVDRHAFDDADMSDVIMQYDHAGRVFARISNDTLQLSVDDHGLKVRAYLGGTELGRQVYDEIKGGYSTKMSFAFMVEKDSRVVTENHDDGTVDVLRTILKISKTYDVSVVSLPANDGTEISARNDGEGVIAEIRQEIAAAQAAKAEKEKLIAINSLLRSM